MRSRAIAVAALLVIDAAAAAAVAQVDRERFERQLDQLRRDTLTLAPQVIPPEQRVFFDYGVYLTFDYLALDDPSGEHIILRQYDATYYTRLNLDQAHEFFLRGRLTYRDFAPGDVIDGDGSGLVDPDIDVGYYRFDLAGYLGSTTGELPPGNLVAQVGRDFIYWGNGLVLGERVDGALVDLTYGDFALTLLAGVTPVRTVDFDSSRPSYFYNTRRGFYGARATLRGGPHAVFAYGLIQRDYNDDVLDVGGVTTEFDYDSFYLGVGAGGAITDRLLYSVEAVVQTGEALSNSFVFDGPFLVPVEQSREDIQAFAADVRLDYLFTDPNRSRLSAEFLVATGDDDRLHTSNTFGGNAPGTDDRAFNAWGLVNTGYSFAPTLSNLMMVRGGASTFPFSNAEPFRQLQVGADVFGFWKFDADAPIDETTLDQRYLGWETDLFLNWQITSDVSLAIRYGVFFPSPDAFPEDDIRQFLATSLTFAL
jgi:hypothetical protein